jgi:hypothetical protein
MFIEYLDPSYLKSRIDNLDVLLSTRASEATLGTIRDRLIPLFKADIFNTAVTANANIFAAALTPTNSQTLFRIYASFNAAGVLSVARTKGAITVVEQLNSGNTLAANAAYIFDILVTTGESINLRYSVAATALSIKVAEIPSIS